MNESLFLLILSKNVTVRQLQIHFTQVLNKKIFIKIDTSNSSKSNHDIIDRPKKKKERKKKHSPIFETPSLEKSFDNPRQNNENNFPIIPRTRHPTEYPSFHRSVAG